MKTNRDLYLFVGEMASRVGELSLVEFLRRLEQLAGAFSGQKSMSLDEFTGLLEGALSLVAETGGGARPGVPEFEAWRRRLRQQIADLEGMRAQGVFENPHRYFGTDAPSGARWYNFDVAGYLECATMGTFGGWLPGDDTGRGYVPGKVAVLDGDGNVSSVDPQDLDNPIEVIEPIDWEAFEEFLIDGAQYE